MTSPVGIKGHSRRRAAFSLVELLVVAAIMGIMAGVAAVSLRGLRSPALANAAGEVSSALKMARQMAISSGRRTVFITPITPISGLVTNVYRSYAIFEEIPPGAESRDVAYTNPVNAPSKFVARTEWRTLPEGIFFCNLATGGYSSINADPFNNLKLGEPTIRSLDSSQKPDGQEWNFFASFNAFDLRRPERPDSASLANQAMPFIGFNADGRAFLIPAGTFGQGAIRLVQGFVVNNALAVTDTNNYYYIEVDSMVGRIRVRPRDSFR